VWTIKGSFTKISWEEDNLDKQFLFVLLATHSPSGYEMNIQKKWLNYIRPFADEIKTDHAGNVIGVLNPEANFKVLLATHCDEIGLIIKHIDEKGFLYFDKVGWINEKTLVGMHIEILTENGVVPGVIGVNAEHLGGLKDKFSVDDLFIDCGFQSKKEAKGFVNVGDLAVYQSVAKEMKNRLIAGKALDNKANLFIASQVLKQLSKHTCDIGVYIASTVNEETNMHGAFYTAAGIKPNIAIVCDVTFAIDFPNVEQKKFGDVTLNKGPVIAKGSPINRPLNQFIEKSAEIANVNLQYEITPEMTLTDADKIQFTNKGVPVALISLPLRYMHSPIETVSIQDIEDQIKLLVQTIRSLTGKENFNPLEQ